MRDYHPPLHAHPFTHTHNRGCTSARARTEVHAHTHTCIHTHTSACKHNALMGNIVTGSKRPKLSLVSHLLPHPHPLLQPQTRRSQLAAS
jgi:hypothetical protein